MSRLSAAKIWDLDIHSRLYRHSTVLIFGGLILIWQFISLFYAPTQFPGLVDIADGMNRMFDGSERYEFWDHVPMTLFRILSAVVISMAVGIPIGVVMGSNDSMSGVLLLYLLILLAVPSVMWAFLAITWFGLTTYLVPLFATVLALLPYVIINVWKGTEAVDSKLLEMGTVFDVSTWSLWRQIYLPHLMPFIFSTTRMVFSLSWRIMLVVEIFGTQRGVGFVINSYFISQQNNMLLAWVIPMLVLIFALERLLQRVENNQFAWRETADETKPSGV